MEQSLMAFEEKNIAPISFEDDNIDGPHVTNLEEEMHPQILKQRGKINRLLVQLFKREKRNRDEKTSNFFAPRTIDGAQRSIKSTCK